jgi:hypothetical protein
MKALTTLLRNKITACAFVSILVASCTVQKHPITGLTEYDYPYQAECEMFFKHLESPTSYAMPIDIDGKGHLITIEVQRIPEGRGFVIHEGMASLRNYKTTAAKRIPDSDEIVSLAAYDVLPGNEFKEILLITRVKDIFRLTIYNYSSFEPLGIYDLFKGIDVNKDGNIDSYANVIGSVDCDGDGQKDIIIAQGKERDRFPLAIFGYSIKVRHILWTKFISSHVASYNFPYAQMIDVDGDGRDDIVLRAETANNPTILKAFSNVGVYYSSFEDKTKNGCSDSVCGVFDNSFNIKELIYGDSSRIVYDSFLTDSLNEYSGQYSYLQVIRTDGTTIWEKRIEPVKRLVSLSVMGAKKLPKLICAARSYGSSTNDSTLLMIINGSNGIVLSQKWFDGNVYNPIYYEVQGIGRIFTTIKQEGIFILDSALNIIDSKKDINIMDNIGGIDIDGDSIPEFVVHNSLGGALIVDHDLNPWCKLDVPVGIVYSAYVNNSIKGESQFLVHDNYSDASVLVKKKPITVGLFILRYRYYLVSLLLLENITIAIAFLITWRRRTTIKDLIVLADMFSEYEVGLLMVHKKRNTLFVNKYLAKILNLPDNSFINLTLHDPGKDSLSEIIARAKQTYLENINFTSWATSLSTAETTHDFSWANLTPKSGSLMKGFYTIIGFDRTEFNQGRWALIWGLVAQRKLHKKTKAPKILIDKYLSRIENAGGDIESITKLREKIDDIMTLAADLLKGSQLDQPELEIFDIRESIRKIYNDNRDLTTDGEIEIGLDLTPDPVYVRGLRVRLHDCLENIVGNAIKALGGKGEIVVACKLAHDLQGSSNGEWVEIRIRDYGCGIAPEDIGRVFDRNFTRFEGGSGFGLTFAKQIIENHGGRISIESELGKYTVVTVHLPLHDGGD